MIEKFMVWLRVKRLFLIGKVRAWKKSIKK